MHIISVSDFGLWKNTEERGVEDSRSAKTTGVYRAFFSVTLGTHEEYYRRQPVQIDEPRYKILRTSQCSLHAPVCEGQADKIRRDGRAPGHRKALHRKIERTRRILQAPTAPPIDVRQRKQQAKIKGAHRQGWGLGNVLPRVLAMVNRQGTAFG